MVFEGGDPYMIAAVVGPRGRNGRARIGPDGGRKEQRDQMAVERLAETGSRASASGGRPGSETRRKGAAERILETATELFYQRGIRAVGVDEIVRQAGATKPSLYHRFGSKDDLVAACLGRIAEKARAELDARIAGAGDDPLAQLRALVGYCADRVADPEFRGSPMSNTAVEFPDHDHPARAVVVASKVELRERVLAMTRRLATNDPEEMAAGIILLIEGAFSTHHIFGPEGPASALARLVDRLIGLYLRVGEP